MYLHRRWPTSLSIQGKSTDSTDLSAWRVQYLLVVAPKPGNEIHLANLD